MSGSMYVNSMNDLCNDRLVDKNITDLIKYNNLKGRPSIIARLNGIDCLCLLDSGATVNVMDKETMKKIGNVNMKICKIDAGCANKSTLDILGEVDINVEINGNVWRMTFLVAEQLSPSIILGMTFFRRI